MRLSITSERNPFIPVASFGGIVNSEQGSISVSCCGITEHRIGLDDVKQKKFVNSKPSWAWTVGWPTHSDKEATGVLDTGDLPHERHFRWFRK